MSTTAMQGSVADYTAWKSVFETNAGLRRNHGATGHRILRNGSDVLVLVEFPDVDSAQAMQADPRLPQALKAAGVQGTPAVSVWADSDEVRY